MDRAARKERIESCIAKWQEKLRLQDWWIYFSEDEEPEDGNLGDADTALGGLTATIRTSSRLFESEEEVTVVHELLEVLMKRLRSYIPDSSREEANIERHQIIQRLIFAFLGIHDFEPTKRVARRQ